MELGQERDDAPLDYLTPAEAKRQVAAGNVLAPFAGALLLALVVVAPATADLLAKMAAGIADDLATTLLLATDKPVLVAPAMNVMMWANPATQANIATLRARGIHVVGPGSGDLACGEEGSGRLSEPHEILDAIETLLGREKILAGLKALVTSGPTH